jgi:lysozyme family protein
MAYFSDYHQGNSGQGVTDLQKALQSVGYPISADGQFGGETEAAVEHFQAARGVEGDIAGVAGPPTLIAISQANNEGWMQAGFFYLALPKFLAKGKSAPAAPPTTKLSTSPASPFNMDDKTKLVLGGAALLGAAWLFTSRR